MFRLRRVITNLWTPTPQDGGGNDVEAAASAHQQAPQMISRDASRAGDSLLNSENGNSRELDRRAGDQNSLSGTIWTPTRDILLSNPWGTHDAHPPPGWSTAAHGKKGAVQHPSSATEEPSSNMTITAGPCPPSSPFSSPVSIATSGGDRRGRVVISPDRGRSRRSVTKRRRDREVAISIIESNFESEDPLLEGQHNKQQQARQCQPSRRCRQRQADSCFVSPVKASHPKLPENGHPELLEFQRPFPPPRLTFRAGLAKVLLARRRKSATQRARSSTRANRRRRRSMDSIARDVFQEAHPYPKQEDEVADEEENDEKRTRVLREWQAREQKEAEFWRRMKRLEEENEKKAEEKSASRRRRREKLNAGADAVFEEARRARDDLMASAQIALEANPGADIPTLRSLFVGTAAPSVRFKDDPEVNKLRLRFQEMEVLLSKIKAAQRAGNLSEMERLLSSAGAKRLKTHPDFVSAHEALRSEKDRAAKAAADARAAAMPVAAAPMAVAPVSATPVAAAPVAAVPVAGSQPQERARRQKVENRAGSPTFLDRSEELKKLVKAKRAVNDKLLSSTDPMVTKMRLGFKKAYQGSLNKLSSDPASVPRVLRDIREKAEVPLLEARNGGYEDMAREFFVFNLADKLVNYAERDHFSAESYRMASPLASLAVELTAEHRHLSELFLGSLYSKCPSAIPLLSFDTAGKSDAEVMLLYGMREEESMPTYLNRTKGLMVLMAAVMQTPPSTSGGLPHPLPLTEGWRWLARLLNSLEEYVRRGHPPPLATGPVLEWFLKIAGFELQKRYGEAVDKVVEAIKTELLPILLPKSKVPNLLDVVIEDYESKGRRFLQPETGIRT